MDIPSCNAILSLLCTSPALALLLLDALALWPRYVTEQGLFLCVRSYEYTWRVAAFDLYEGLGTVSSLFVGTTLTALGDLQQLHTYLLIASIIVFVGLVVFILLPFKKRLVMESVKLAGLLSQLPQVGLHLMRKTRLYGVEPRAALAFELPYSCELLTLLGSRVLASCVVDPIS